MAILEINHGTLKKPPVLCNRKQPSRVSSSTTKIRSSTEKATERWQKIVSD